MHTPVAEHDFFKSDRQIPRQRTVVKIPAVGYMHLTRQLCKLELKI